MHEWCLLRADNLIKPKETVSFPSDTKVLTGSECLRAPAPLAARPGNAYSIRQVLEMGQRSNLFEFNIEFIPRKQVPRLRIA